MSVGVAAARPPPVPHGVSPPSISVKQESSAIQAAPIPSSNKNAAQQLRERMLKGKQHMKMRHHSKCFISPVL